MWISGRYLSFGLALALPFIVANALVRMQSEFFLSIIRPAGQSTTLEHALVLCLIALSGAGGLVALVPILKEKRLYIVNAIVGLALVAFALFAGQGIGYDFYKCNILRIPNCD